MVGCYVKVSTMISQREIKLNDSFQHGPDVDIFVS